MTAAPVTMTSHDLPFDPSRAPVRRTQSGHSTGACTRTSWTSDIFGWRCPDLGVTESGGCSPE